MFRSGVQQPEKAVKHAAHILPKCYIRLNNCSYPRIRDNPIN